MYAMQIKTDSSKAANATHRLCTLDFKTPSDKKDDANYKKPASRCISIPAIALAVEPAILQDALQAAFYDMQDSVIRSIFMTALEASSDKNPIVSITDDQISVEAVAAWAADRAVSGKLSAEKIGAWFDAYLADPLQLALAAAMQLPDEPSAEQQAKLDNAIKQHRTFLGKLAGPQQMPEQLSKQLLSAVKLAEGTDKIQKQLQSKLEASLQPKAMTLEFNLGM